MSDRVTLTLRSPLDQRLEADSVTADACADRTSQEIAALPVWLGAQAACVGDFFDVRGERSSRLRIAGDLRSVVGLASGMAGGELVVDGDVGDRLAAGMCGGSITVLGDVGDEAGLGMAGGTLRVNGTAGDRLGAADAGRAKGMTGGEIVVLGAAGAEAASQCRRGLIVVAGDAGAHAARGMIAGTLVVLGRVGPAPGRGNKRGSVVAASLDEVPATYRYACTYEPPHVRLVMTYLGRRYGLSVDPRLRDGRYRRYCGDAGGPERGEILEWVPGDGCREAGPAVL